MDTLLEQRSVTTVGGFAAPHVLLIYRKNECSRLTVSPILGGRHVANVPRVEAAQRAEQAQYVGVKRHQTEPVHDQARICRA